MQTQLLNKEAVVAADIETSTDEYAMRFSGSVGQWMLERQARLTMALLGGGGALDILDVGGGHGQLARPMNEAGHNITVLGSAPSCVHRLTDLAESGQIKFISGNVLELPFADNSFDTAVCFRLVTHCADFGRLISELCRVARKSVIIDYPTIQSVNIAAKALFGAKRRVEGDTRHWALFRHRQIDEAFSAAGWRTVARRKQFFMPMVFYRLLRSRRFAALLEGVFAAVGLTGLFGSPVIVRAEPSNKREAVK